MKIKTQKTKKEPIKKPLKPPMKIIVSYDKKDLIVYI